MSEGSTERIERLLALILFQGMDDDANSTQRALPLSRAGFKSKEIAELLGASTKTIENRLSEARKSAKKSSKRGGGKSDDV